MVAELDRLQASEWTERLWKIVGASHRRAFDQDGHHEYLAAQRGLDLQPNEVVRIIEPAPAFIVARVEPIAPDHDDEHLAGVDRAGKGLDEVLAAFQIVDVAKDLSGPKVIAQPVEHSAGMACGVPAPIADKNPRHGAPKGSERMLSFYNPSAMTGGLPRTFLASSFAHVSLIRRSLFSLLAPGCRLLAPGLLGCWLLAVGGWRLADSESGQSWV